MGWCWCCWRRTDDGSEEDQREPLAVPSPQETSNGSDKVEVEPEMGQTASRIIGKVLPSKSSPSKSEEETLVIDEADGVQAKSKDLKVDDIEQAEHLATNKSTVSSSPKYPLATPRKPLKSDSITRTLSEVSLSESEPKRLKGDVKYLNYPFLLDNETVHYIQNSKIMFIMKGLPGSGKSTIVKNIQAVYKDVVTCSADYYFMRGGTYNFQPDHLKDAHESCQEEATQAASNGINVIIIDNTNVRNWEMKFYLDLAKEYHYIPVIVEPQTPWCRDARELAKRNSHDVGFDIISKKVKSYQDVLPLYYGWFLNEVDSHSILKLGKEWLRHVLNVKYFHKELSRSSGFTSTDELLGYYSRSSFVHGGPILHSTASFTARGKTDGAMDYINDPLVKKCYGQVFTLEIIGYIITPWTLGARVKLSPDMLKLWGQDDYEEMQETKTISHHRNEPEDKDANENSSLGEINVFAECCQKTVISVPQDLTDRFCPTNDKGSRAHITLGCAPGVKPVRTGFDMMKIVSLEQNVAERGFGTSDASEKSFDIPGGVLRTYGQGYWVIYPENKVLVNTIFSSFN